MNIDEHKQCPMLVPRICDIVLQPKQTWWQIEAERATIGCLYRGYVLILAAIPALSGLIAALLFGHDSAGLRFRPSIGSALGVAIAEYAASLIFTFVLGMVISALAPRFGGSEDPVRAFKVAAYSGTTAWLAAGLAALPSLGWVAIAGLHSLYLLHTGLPRVMQVPSRNALSYTIATVIVGAVIALAVVAAGASAGRIIGQGG